MKMVSKEWVSALADGHLSAEEAALCLDAVAHDPEALIAWQSYHLIGDVLRSPDFGAVPARSSFVSRLAQRLESEQVLPASLPVAPEEVRVGPAHSSAPAANEGVFRWKLVAGFASAAAVAAVGWSVLNSAAPAAQPQLATAPGVQSLPQRDTSSLVLAGGARGVMIRDAQLDALLAAHQQLGGVTALQTPSGFLRNATFDGPAR
jgi:sigma-E factor negative regulatory protein RseA